MKRFSFFGLSKYFTRSANQRAVQTGNAPALQEAALQETDRLWVTIIVEYLIHFDRESHAYFTYDPEMCSVTCDGPRTNQSPQIEFGILKNVSPRKWKQFWQFVEAHAQTKAHPAHREGELYRDLSVYGSPRSDYADPYRHHPHRIDVWLYAPLQSAPSKERTFSDGKDGPCTCHGC